MDYRNKLEKELHVLVEELLETLTHPKISRHDFMIQMGHLRDAKVHLDNKKMGCPTGFHASECYCESGIERSTTSRPRKVA